MSIEIRRGIKICLFYKLLYRICIIFAKVLVSLFLNNILTVNIDRYVT